MSEREKERNTFWKLAAEHETVVEAQCQLKVNKFLFVEWRQQNKNSVHTHKKRNTQQPKKWKFFFIYTFFN